jgi:sirohydrochlorin cobaltochelatase
VIEFADSSLVLIGHGSAVNAESAVSVREHGARLRANNVFAEVQEIFWKETPDFENAAKRTAAPRVFFVPMFISEGYFSERAIPIALGFRSETADAWNRFRLIEGRTFIYCKPVGTHPAMTEVILERAKQVLDQFPFPRRPNERDVSLFIAGHGTEKDAASRRSIDAQVALIRESGLYAQVESVFIEEEPRVSACVELARAKNIVVVPFFMSEGMHVQEDLPVMLGTPARVVKERLAKKQSPWRNPTERKEKLIWYSSSVGTDPRITEVIIERVREAAVLNLPATKSP